MSTLARTSIAAYRSLSVGTIRDEIANLIISSGEIGMISDEILSHFPTEDRQSSSAVTGRFSELERDGVIYRAGDTRPGRSGRQQKIMRAASHISAFPIIKPKKAKKDRSPFLEGLIYSAKIMLKSDDLDAAKKALKAVIEKERIK